MMRLKQVHFIGKKNQTERKLLLLHVQPIRLLNLSLEYNASPKKLLLRKEKSGSLFWLIQFYKITEIFRQIQRENNGIILHYFILENKRFSQ
jgi:hypothetical protein